MGIPRQEYWTGLLFLSPGNLFDPRIEPLSPSLADGFFTTEQPGKPHLPKQCQQNIWTIICFNWIMCILEGLSCPEWWNNPVGGGRSAGAGQRVTSTWSTGLGGREMILKGKLSISKRWGNGWWLSNTTNVHYNVLIKKIIRVVLCNCSIHELWVTNIEWFFESFKFPKNGSGQALMSIWKPPEAKWKLQGVAKKRYSPEDQRRPPIAYKIRYKALSWYIRSFTIWPQFIFISSPANFYCILYNPAKHTFLSVTKQHIILFYDSVTLPPPLSFGWKIPWRMKWQPTPVSLPGKSHGQRSLVSCSPWGHQESGTTEWLTLT